MALIRRFGTGRLRPSESIDCAHLIERYHDGSLTVVAAMEGMLQRLGAICNSDNVWISRVSPEKILEQARRLDEIGISGSHMPLFGLPFAIKDNIDLKGLPTTNGLPMENAFTPNVFSSSFAVKQLERAGAICLGKTNMDQTATGLVGVRSPYGAVPNAFDDSMVSGGSSSGSAIAVATGQATFSLGTDTAGSGRVPAALNNIVGIKPTRGVISTAGVIPACRSIDSVSIFALSVGDARQVLSICSGFDANDPYSRPTATGRRLPYKNEAVLTGECRHVFRFGVPDERSLNFFGNDDFRRSFDSALQAVECIGGESVEIDFEPFLEAARLLYEGPWVAERFVANHKQLSNADICEGMHPVVRDILLSGKEKNAVDTFASMYRLEELKRLTSKTMDGLECLITPTCGTAYSIKEVEEDPVQLNSNLGYYCNYLNLLDMCAVACPAGFTKNGFPFGLTIASRSSNDNLVCDIAALLESHLGLTAGATGVVVAKPPSSVNSAAEGLSEEKLVRLALLGAHMTGLELNDQLTSRGGRMVERTYTAECYKLWAFEECNPPRPGITEVSDDEKQSKIELEVWEIPVSEFGSFVAMVPPPLTIGHVKLESGEVVKSFTCPESEVRGRKAIDISQYKGWRSFLCKDGLCTGDDFTQEM